MVAQITWSQGLYWETHRGRQDTAEVSRFYLLPKMFKEVSGDGGRVTIVRLDKDIKYEINPREKTYTQTTFAEMEESLKKGQTKLAEELSKMKDKLGKMPPEARKMLEEQMGALMGKSSPVTKVEVVNTGEHATISGYSATKTVFRRDGKDMITFWTTKDIKEFTAFRDEFTRLIQRNMAMNPFAREFADAFGKLDGFPVQTETGSSKETVTRVEKRPLSASEFDVPVGYTLKR
jgi:hypothetical protein